MSLQEHGMLRFQVPNDNAFGNIMHSKSQMSLFMLSSKKHTSIRTQFSWEGRSLSRNAFHWFNSMERKTEKMIKLKLIRSDEGNVLKTGPTLKEWGAGEDPKHVFMKEINDKEQSRVWIEIMHCMLFTGITMQMSYDCLKFVTVVDNA